MGLPRHTPLAAQPAPRPRLAAAITPSCTMATGFPQRTSPTSLAAKACPSPRARSSRLVNRRPGNRPDLPRSTMRPPRQARCHRTRAPNWPTCAAMPPCTPRPRHLAPHPVSHGSLLARPCAWPPSHELYPEAGRAGESAEQQYHRRRTRPSQSKAGSGSDWPWAAQPFTSPRAGPPGSARWRGIADRGRAPLHQTSALRRARVGVGCPGQSLRRIG